MTFFQQPKLAIRLSGTLSGQLSPKNSYPAIRNYPADKWIACQSRLSGYSDQLSELSADSSVEHIVKPLWNMSYPAVRLSAPYGGVPTPDSWDTPRAAPMFFGQENLSCQGLKKGSETNPKGTIL